MADTTTIAKAFTKPEIGAHPDTWGNVLNTNFDLIDSSVGGVVSIGISGNFTLSNAQAANLLFGFTGALGADATITFPPFRGFAFVRNQTTGGHNINCQMNTGGAAVPVTPGIDRLLIGDGANFFSNVLAVNKAGDTMTGPLVINSNLTVSGVTTIGQYLYLNGAGGGAGPMLYGDGTNMALKPGAGNGQLFLYNSAGAARGSFNFSSGAMEANGGYYNNGKLLAASDAATWNQFYAIDGVIAAYLGAGQTYLRNDTLTIDARDTTVAAQFTKTSILLNHNTTAAGNLQVNGTGIFQQNITVGGLGVSNNSGYLAIAAPLMVGNIGIQYTAFSGGGSDGSAHSFRFGWGSGHVVAAVDGTGAVLQLANTGDLSAYLPLSGGVVSGNLTVSGNAQVNGGLGVSGNVTFNGNLAVGNVFWVGGLAIYNNGGYVWTDSAINVAGINNRSTLSTAGYSELQGGVHIQNGLYVQGSRITCDGDYIVAQNVQAANDITAAGVYRRYPAGTGYAGARIECLPSGSWQYLAFIMISGGYLGVSPDDGTSGFNYAPNGSWSDISLKTGIVDSQVDALAAILATPIRSFDWNEEGRKRMPSFPDHIPVGLVAQEVEQTMPEVVHSLGDFDSTLMVRSEMITPYLLRAIQQLAARLEALEAKP